MLVQNAYLASFPKRFRVGCVEELGLDTRQRAQAAFLSGPKQVNVSDLLVVPLEGSFAEAPNARRANVDCGRCHKGCGTEIRTTACPIARPTLATVLMAARTAMGNA